MMKAASKQLIFIFILLQVANKCVHAQWYLPQACLTTFADISSETFPFTHHCPSSCFTIMYLSSKGYPIYGNVSYSQSSVICKSALHDSRVSQWSNINPNSSVRILTGGQMQSFGNALRNGIVSLRSTTSANSYIFDNPRINESIPDIAIEHRNFLYSKESDSRITCKSKNHPISNIRPLDVDVGWETWTQSRLQYFTKPVTMTRNAAISFCDVNNGTLMYVMNMSEQNVLQNIIQTTLDQLFKYQRARSNNTLFFHFGYKKANNIELWENSPIADTFHPMVNETWSSTTDYCTYIQSIGIQFSNAQFQIISNNCQDNVARYPLCRRLPKQVEYDFIYRVSPNVEQITLNRTVTYCQQFGGYPVYALNAYEWQLVQEIWLMNPVYSFYLTGLLNDESKKESTAFWYPMNITYNTTLDYLIWGRNNGGPSSTRYHGSKSDGESYYAVYDTADVLTAQIFCRKPDVRKAMTTTGCYSTCTGHCLTVSLPASRDDERFGLFTCQPQDSSIGIITQSFPRDAIDFYRPSLPMSYAVFRRQPFTTSSLILRLSLNSTNDLRDPCFEYLNMGAANTPDSYRLSMCDHSTNTAGTLNKTMGPIIINNGSNGIMTFANENRRLFGHHVRVIDNILNDGRCSHQGVYHVLAQQCICAPGFYGVSCEYNCPAGYYGQACDFQCDGNNYCRDSLICLPDPYGCSCYTGWYGTACNETCPQLQYGPNCENTCTGCSTYCDRFTGICDCNGTECYRGNYKRSDIIARCGQSSNLAVLIAAPLSAVFFLAIVVVAVGAWRWRKKNHSENLVSKSPISSSSPEEVYDQSVKRGSYAFDGGYYNNTMTERL